MKLFNYKKIAEKKEISGFAMLFAVLASSLLIALGISIFNISLKELQIATSEKDSQAAYYAADSAEECALYWDIKMGAFPTCLNSECNPNTPGDVSTTTTPIITCNGNSIYFNFSNPTSLTFSSTTQNFFQASSTNITFPAADLTISKEFFPASGLIQSTTTADGHNSEIIGRRVERGIQEVYNSQ